ncbi:MAG: protein-glutamate O-methyltransferase [Gammaproteobacteria bacterium]|nr:protein-glutamate O-methyltransferase [Gammaproteobacteria bacterium]MBU1655318.1 protein-glutamate O-methyltransferase [Gammaproteobacteria bacterium]MBU1961463.1 protein-glutamate O-methyltransferase [Gammaproteobacteria bacterium]
MSSFSEPEAAPSPRRWPPEEPSGICREFRFARSDFDYLRKLVTAHTGIVLAENKYDMLYARLVRRVRHLGLSGFGEYVELIRSGQGEEFVQLINAITTNLTAFFREPHHFDYLRKWLAPIAAGGQGLRIWSAGCATGEEPYSIAMTLLEALPQARHGGIGILASDLDSHALEQAQNGIYPLERINALGLARQQRWFLRGKGRNSGLVRVKPELQAPIQFHSLNLLSEWPIKPGLDAIFCRNVLIYFDRQTKQGIVKGFTDLLKPGGYLFLGHSEALIGITERFEPSGRSCYRLKSGGPQ